MSVNWFRWWHGSVTDPKFGAVSLRAKCSLPETLAVWVALLEHASQADNRGDISDCPADEVAWALRMDIDTVTSILSAMESRGLIRDGRIEGWERRQPLREDAVGEEAKPSSQRVREYRQRQKLALEAQRNADETPCNADETPCNADETPQRERREDTEKIRGEGEQSEVDSLPTASREAEDPAPASPSRAQRSEPPASRLPKNWALPKSWGEWALRERPDWDQEHVRAVSLEFRDHWFARAGPSAVKVDWLAAWRSWVRRERDAASRINGRKPNAQEALEIANRVATADWKPPELRERVA